MSARLERGLMLATPMVAMAAVALGMRIGAGNAVRAAVVSAAPASGAGTGLAWQVVAFDEERNYREPAPRLELDVDARGDGREVHWHGVTSEDGVAEMLLPFTDPAVHLEVHAGGTLLAAGDAAAAPPLARDAPATSWAPFARREGDVVLDVAVAGQRVPTGNPMSLWVRATDRATRVPLAGVTLEAERDSAFVPASSHVTTDARGWARLVATPVGHAVAVVLHATAPNGRTGVWAGGLAIAPGAPQLALDERVSPGKGAVIDVVVPTTRTTAYLEIDDARGRAWATVAVTKGTPGENPRATVHVPPLAPGLYWAVESGDPVGASELGAGTIARPFFVAASDEAALAFGTDRDVCAPPPDARDTARAVSACLALAAATPVPRWTALEGFTAQHARDAAKGARGLALALWAILVAVVLELVLLLKASATSRARLRAAESAGTGRLVGRGWSVALAVLVAMMGLALMAAFLARVG